MIPSTFRQDLFDKAQSGKIRVGICESFSNLPPTKAVIRGVGICRDTLN